ncbi:MAG TPA: SDR family oxidoreductase [Chloroflexia bacterium]|jgi:short-subunit dehydrogenase
MAKPLSEQVVVITGASSGIGRETALRLAGRGAKVIVSARSDEALDELVGQITSAGGEATSISADVSIYSDVEALASGAVEKYGRIDTWVNNAGVLIVGEFENTDLDEARRLFDVNFWGELHGCKAVLPIMKSQGGGTIVNVTSVTARRPLPLMSVYSASKAALNGLSEGLRTELEGTGVELCIVMPATIDTPLFEHARSKEGVAPRPVPPIYPPSEVARAIERVAEKPQRQIFAGPAGIGFHVGNFLMPDVLDKALAKFGWTQLTSQPEPPRGNDNLNRGMGETPGRTSGGWRGRRYKGIELASRIGLGLAALFLVRKLVRR